MANTFALLNEFYVQASESLLVTNAGSTVVTVNGDSLSKYMSIDDLIIGVKMTVTETAAGDGAIDARLEGSIDEAAWTVVDSTASLDLDTTGANTVSGVLSAVGYSFPYWRVVIFTDGVDLVDPCTVAVVVAARHIGYLKKLIQSVLASGIDGVTLATS